MIKQYSSHISQNGYNSSSGGKSGAKGTIRSEEWKIAMSQRVSGDGHPLYGKHHSAETRKKISNARRNRSLSEKSRSGHIQAGKKLSKPVVCLETGIEYASQTEASKSLGVPRGAVSIACNKFPKRTAGGFHWQFVNSRSPTIHSVADLPIDKHAPKAVLCLETQCIYNSMHDAAVQTGFDIRHISRCCREPNRTTKGMHWRYFDGKPEQD